MESRSKDQPLGQELLKSKMIIDQFIYGCSHSIRAPLKSISGLAYLLNGSIQNPDESVKYVQLIQQSVAKMELLLNELEECLENSKSELKTEPVNLESLVNCILENFNDGIACKSITITIHVDQPVHLFSDSSRLRLILHHLVSNAIAFHDNNKEKKYINIVAKTNLSGCSIKVQDNGMGMMEEVRKNVFRLFYRGTERSSGCGMGLYIVDEIVRKMNGSIFVSSQENEGSDFFVWIPNNIS